MKSVKTMVVIFAGLAILILLVIPSCQHDLVYHIPDEPIVPNDTDSIIVPIDTLYCDTCAAGVISFTEDVLPILQSNCTKTGCHDAITQEAELNTTSYQTLMSSQHSPAGGLGSDFWHVLSGGGGDPMPPPPNLPLTAQQLSVIQLWLQQGYQNTTCTHICACDTVNVSFTSKIYPAIQTFCLGCHSTGSAQGGVDLTGYPNVSTQVNNGKLMKSIKHESGVVAMPYNATKLNDCTISKFQSWVNAGAPNN